MAAVFVTRHTARLPQVPLLLSLIHAIALFQDDHCRHNLQIISAANKMIGRAFSANKASARIRTTLRLKMRQIPSAPKVFQGSRIRSWNSGLSHDLNSA